MTEAAEVDSVARYASARIDAVRDADANALDRLLHGDPVYIHASGRREDKSGYIESSPRETLSTEVSYFPRSLPRRTTIGRRFGQVK